jgi:predicted small secreted protein
MRRRHATLVPLLLCALLVTGCATGRSVTDTVSGWFHRDAAQTPAAGKAPAKRKAKAPAAEAAPPEPAPDAAATGAATEPSPEAEPPAPPDEPKKTEPSVFDPY